MKRWSIALGGISADAHSVGLIVLRRALGENGYDVHYMGTQNSLESFFRAAERVDVVMISCMDGHLRHYLAEFPDLRLRFPAAVSGALWYAGGNIALHDPRRVHDDVRRLGFSRVFTGYVEVSTVLGALAADLAGRRPRSCPPPAALPAPGPAGRGVLPLEPPPPDDRLDAAEFHRLREGVLTTWPTGGDARDLADNARFLLRQPSFAGAQARAEARPRRPRPLLHPRSGVALADRQLAAFRTLSRYGADVLSYQVDSLTRNNAYAMAADAIAESRETGTSALNGFPMVNHGVRTLRRIGALIGRPLQTRHSTRDPRLLAEISCAGGVTAFEGGAICYNIPYFRDYPLAVALRRWQYVDRLAGIYAEDYGVIIDREFFGTLTAVLIPPCLAIVVNLIQALLAVAQGVQSVSLGYAEQGNRTQDVAAIRVLRELGGKYLANMGYHGVRMNTVFHQYMAAFPADRERARQLIVASGATARLSGATRVMVKTPVEAVMIPSVEDNVEGLALARQGAESAGPAMVDERAVAAEMAVIREEVEQIFESVITCGGGSLTAGVVRAFARGHIDIPFAPSRENRGEVITARDAQGAVRLLDPGRLRLSAEIIAFHRDKIAERRAAEERPVRGDWELVERDVHQITCGRYPRWPLHE
ncbi:MAG TPA: methylaspartate mutase subunit E [Streptosporangiaceae bacterium]